MNEAVSLYNKANPFLSRIKERYSLCKPGSAKSTVHIVLDLKGSGIRYAVGDSIAVQPINDPQIVEKTVNVLRATGSETIVGKHWTDPIPLREALARKLNLAEVPRKLIAFLAQNQSHPEKKERLGYILSEGQREALKEYQEAHEVWDALEENAEVAIDPQELCHMLQPLLPRFYSIASSMSAVGDEVHLTVAELIYETNGHTRRGVCTNYLCNLAKMGEPEVAVYLQPSHGFTVPDDPSTPLIMVGPGTGVAPYRGFMQEREAQGAVGPHWLFFGEWHRATEFFYEEYWQMLAGQQKLRLDTAFSRDQEHKIYVQHKLLEHGKELYEWLERGAVFYVCGDARRMAKDVDAALHKIIEVHGGYGEQGVKDYIKKLKAEKKYLRDVY